MNDELDGAGRTHIDRRTLLKRAGAAGALGLAAPIAFDSFFSPAAACSVGLGATPEVNGVSWSSAPGAGAVPVSPAFNVASGSLVVVAFNVVIADTSNSFTPTVTVEQSAPVTLSFTQVPGTAKYFNLGSGPNRRHGFLEVWTAVAPSALNGVTITVGCNGDKVNFVGHVAEVAGVTAATTTVRDTNRATVSTGTPTINLPGTQAGLGTATAEVVVFADRSVGATATNAWGAFTPASFAEVTDGSRSAGASDADSASLQIGFRSTAAASVSGTRTATNLPSATAAWAAVAIEVDC